MNWKAPLILVSLFSLTLVACDGGSSASAPTPQAPKADNTDRNKADRDTSTKTPLDQSNAAADTRITADIRKAVLDDAALSTNAHNCKIITDKGVVTLRGPVNSPAEKDSVEAKAKAVAGVTSVVNELEVKN